MAGYRNPVESTVTFCGICGAQQFDGVAHNCIFKSPAEIKLDNAVRLIEQLEAQVAELKRQVYSLTDWRERQVGGK